MQEFNRKKTLNVLMYFISIEYLKKVSANISLMIDHRVYRCFPVSKDCEFSIEFTVFFHQK